MRCIGIVKKERRQDRDGIAHLELFIVELFTPYKSTMESLLSPLMNIVLH